MWLWWLSSGLFASRTTTPTPTHTHTPVAVVDRAGRGGRGAGGAEGAAGARGGSECGYDGELVEAGWVVETGVVGAVG